MKRGNLGIFFGAEALSSFRIDFAEKIAPLPVKSFHEKTFGDKKMPASILSSRLAAAANGRIGARYLHKLPVIGMCQMPGESKVKTVTVLPGMG